MLPSITLSKVEGIPSGRKLSADGPILALGIQACDLQMSSRCVIMASAATEGRRRHAA